MHLKSSPKIYKNYKSDYPKNTIRNINNGFKKIGLNLKYKQQMIHSSKFSIYSGYLLLEDVGFSTVGKGTSSILAKASAFAEMAERYSAGFLIFRTIYTDIEKYNSIIQDLNDRKFLEGFKEDNKNLITINKINNYFHNQISKEQYQVIKNQKTISSTVNAFSFIKKKYLKIPIKFIEMQSGSTGLSAGNTIEEALVQASCEIFERYAITKILLEKIKCATINIDTISDPRIHNLIELYNNMNIEVVIKDFTLSNTIPTIGLIFINNNLKKDKNKMKKDFYYKMISAGSHPNLNEAILRSLTERLQELTKNEFMYRKKTDLLYNHWTKVLNNKYLGAKTNFKNFYDMYHYKGGISFLEKGEKINFTTLSSKRVNDCYDDFKIICDICKKNKWDIQAINFTNKTLNFPTVRVIIPIISTDYDPYVRELLKLNDYKDRFNYYYDVKDLYNYVFKKNWINDKRRIKELINNIESYLSTDLQNYYLSISRGVFHQYINLFSILAFSHLSSGNVKKAIKYFELLVKINDNPPFYSEFYNNIFNNGYKPSIFSSYIKLLKKSIDKSSKKQFKFEDNPFNPKIKLQYFDDFYEKLLKNINSSFFKEI